MSFDSIGPSDSTSLKTIDNMLSFDSNLPASDSLLHVFPSLATLDGTHNQAHPFTPTHTQHTHSQLNDTEKQLLLLLLFYFTFF